MVQVPIIGNASPALKRSYRIRIEPLGRAVAITKDQEKVL
jgi:hypothetical protein